MTRRRALAALAITCSTLATGCGGDPEPVRVGVMTDCIGAFRSFEEQMLAGAELPFLARGARHVDRPDGRITDARLAGGRTVELVRGCIEGGEYTSLIHEARRLVERERVDMVVGGSWPGDGIALREVAQLYPSVPFLAAMPGPQEVTEGRAPANLYRVSPTFAQAVAGLASYAWAELGWRRASIVVEDFDRGWGEAAAFVSEFCALGGQVGMQEMRFPLDVDDATVDRLTTEGDGVAVFGSWFSSGLSPPAPAPFLARLARRLGDADRRLVVGAGIASEPQIVRAAGAALDGVVAPKRTAPRNAASRSYERRFTSSFPDLRDDDAARDFALGYYETVEAAMQALERVDGDVSNGRARLRRALARLTALLPSGPLTMDGNRQAVVVTSLVRLGSAAEEPIARFAGVDRTLGGLLTVDEPPASGERRCVPRKAPEYARVFLTSRD